VTRPVISDPAEEAANHPWRNLYGRRRGKALRPGQKRLVEELLPKLRVPGVAPPGDPLRAAVDPRALFPDGRPLWLEVGFGGGEHLVHQARSNPEVGLIGCEPYVNGVAMALARIAVANVGNVRLHPGDARDLIELLPPASVARVFLLYPDPWPKARHARRRFMHPENLAMLARVMPPGAELRLATDIPGYVAHALEAVAAGEAFRHDERNGADHGTPWPGWPGTRYEAKALRAGRRGHYLTFIRV
jgi:tRNA (guanine-N7-)-methyltransferase